MLSSPNPPQAKAIGDSQIVSPKYLKTQKNPTESNNSSKNDIAY